MNYCSDFKLPKTNLNETNQQREKKQSRGYLRHFKELLSPLHENPLHDNPQVRKKLIEGDDKTVQCRFMYLPFAGEDWVG